MGRLIKWAILTVVILNPYEYLDYSEPNLYFIDQRDEGGIEVHSPEPEPAIETPGEKAGQIIDNWFNDFSMFPYKR